ncbi:DUF6916 family protein [Sphingomonas sp.]|jgi:hypothetical protein|uniref:DUF6916 family protein n=1 Tax=Sphingomonas sp. TaxID=28214 RepID=UPI002E31DE25|nr:hypothetical protein [Sphingomonas sp.]HEX4695943.1 hypothetical protein [Sphingomonas sp.]
MATLTVEDFAPHVGTVFTLPAGDGAEALHFTLVEANPLKVSTLPEGARPPFELVFREPGPTVYQQGMYRLVHPTMGEHDIFIVPNAYSEAEGATYSATFN